MYIDNPSKEERLHHINQMLIKLALHDFDLDFDISEDRDLLDAVALGIKLLGDELETSTISQDYLNSIYRGVADMLFILSPDHKIASVNNPANSILGYSEGELQDKTFKDLVHDIELSYLDNVYHELYQNGFCYDIELFLQKKNGELIPVTCSTSLLHNAKGEVNGILYIAKDNSKIKKKEEELYTKDRELDAFIFKASHDLNGPLSTIKGITRLANKETNEEHTKRYLDMINATVEKLDGTLLDLVELTKLNNIRTKIAMVNYKESINEIVNRLHMYVAGPHEIEVKVDIDHQCSFFSVPRLIYSIFQNIIENAFKYRQVKTNHHSYLFIDVFVDDEKMMVTFEDNGIGVSDERKRNIFESFSMQDTSLNGAGLGLYITRNNIERLKGKISFTTIENEGTIFKIEVPNEISSTILKQ